MRTSSSYTSAVQSHVAQDLSLSSPLKTTTQAATSILFASLIALSPVANAASDTTAASAASVAASTIEQDETVSSPNSASATSSTSVASSAETSTPSTTSSATSEDKVTQSTGNSTDAAYAVADAAGIITSSSKSGMMDDAGLESGLTDELTSTHSANVADKTAAVEKFNAFASERPKRAGALSDGGLNSTAGIVQWLLSTIAVLGIIFVLAFLIKKTRLVQRSGGTMRLETQMALGPKERLVQVRVGDRHLLLGVTPTNVNFILELDRDTDSQKPSQNKHKRVKHTKVEADDADLPADDACSHEPLVESGVDERRSRSNGLFEPSEVDKAKIKAQAARKVAARATGTVNMMPDDDVLHERASRSKCAMSRLPEDEIVDNSAANTEVVATVSATAKVTSLDGDVAAGSAAKAEATSLDEDSTTDFSPAGVAVDEMKDDSHSNAETTVHVNPEDASKGKDFSEVFAKAYAEGKARYDELTATEAGRDMMAADPHSGEFSSESTKTESQGKS